MRKPTKQQIIERLERENTGLRASAERFEEKLSEARRRTVPLNYGDQDINFLPVAINKLDMNGSIKTFQGSDGISHHVRGHATCTIVCDGYVVMSPNQSQPARRAEPEKKVPPPDLGWKIVNEYADSITDKVKQNYFIADCRQFEGGFTSGHLTEELFRIMLQTLIPKSERKS